MPFQNIASKALSQQAVKPLLLRHWFFINLNRPFMAGFLMPKSSAAEAVRKGKNTHMNRTNRKHNRQVERHRLNKGPELFCRAADNELQKNATEMAKSLRESTLKSGNAAAAHLLVDLAQAVSYNDNPAAFVRAFSLADKWAKEPQVVTLDTVPRLSALPPKALLTDGTPPVTDEADETADEAETCAHGEAAGSNNDAGGKPRSSGFGLESGPASGSESSPKSGEILEAEWEDLPGASTPTPAAVLHSPGARS
jgi:hypothetical protein